MKIFAAQRLRNISILAVLCGIALFSEAVLAVSLRAASFYSGGLLGASILVLASYNLFKKVPFLPLGRSALWLQVHIYLGLLTILVFGLHVGAHLPRGWLGWSLEALFVGVAGSGLIGLTISRTYPALLTARGPEVILEQIPILRKHLREQADQLVLEAAAELHSTYVADYYTQRLRPFFDGSRNFWRHVTRTSHARHAMLTEIDAQNRYLNDKERVVLHTLRGLVKRKDDLDFQYALQAMLKYWLFFHIPMTCCLLMFSAFHLLVVYAYAGVPW